MERWQQIESLFQEALQRDPAERDAWLREACNGDSGLQREIASLLANHQEATGSESWAAAAAAKLIAVPASFEAGQQLGPYEIVAPIGAGGMGKVYRARDTRLKRDVAIKVCGAQFSDRFGREARVIASLNHPNICQVYDVGPNFLVMELVEGPTLQDRIRQGALPPVEALAIARQIAEALKAAHEKGIVHRDLKPANVKITPQGVAKVLDFGLAKAAEEPSDAADPNTSPTLTISPTRAGVILGTAPYMAPEQARGKPVDKRADIWAFGCVLYEMLTGRQAFTGETMTDVLASVVKEQPDLGAVPAHMKPVITRCLSKDPRTRWGDIGDVRWMLEAGQTEATPAAPSRSRLSMAGWIAVAAATLIPAGVALWAPWRTVPQPARLVRFQVPVPEKLTLPGSESFALSPDGSKLAYFAVGEDGAMRLWVRAMEANESRPLPGTEGVGPTPPPPFWSPDSRWIVFAADSKLKKIDVTGGPPQTVCNLAGAPPGGSWNRDGVILYGSTVSPLMRVPVTGGVPSPVAALDASRNEINQRYPFFLPDGRHFLYLRTFTASENTGIYLGSLDAQPGQQGNKRVVTSEHGAAFVPSSDGKTGELLFLRQGTLLSQGFDLARLEPAGEPVPVAEDVGNYRAGGFFSASTNGTLIYRGGTGGRDFRLTWFNRQAKILGSEGEPQNIFGGAALSPNGKQAVVPIQDRQSPSAKISLWLLDFERGGAAHRFTFGGAYDRNPVWSPDGSRIVFSSNRTGAFNLFWKLTSGAKDEEVLRKSDQIETPLSWSRDGRYLLYGVVSPKTSDDLWILPDPGGAAGSRKPMLFQGAEASEDHGQFSPDGRWIAYSSDESGRYEVYVREFVMSPDGSKPEATAKRQISTGGGTAPSWRDDGKELIYISKNRRTVMSVEIATSPDFRAAIPKELCQLPAGAVSAPGAPTLTSDAQRILVAIPEQGNVQQPFTVVLNWTAGLKK